MKTKTMKLAGIILALVMLAMMLGMLAMTASATAAADLTVIIDTAASVTLKDTDADGAYDIGTADELYAFAAAVNSGNTAINGELTANIVVNEGTMSANSTNARVWVPIGHHTSDTNNAHYAGIFDGNGNTISGLYFNGTDSNYFGLFAYVAEGGTVRNVGVINSSFSGFDDFGNYIGGLVGYNKGTVQQCFNTSTIDGNSGKSGGIVGENYGTVENCYNTGSVNGSNIGGIVGRNPGGTVENCYNTGSVSGSGVGGVVGDNSNGFVDSCFNMGKVTGNGPVTVGGVVARGSSGNNCYYLEGTADYGYNGADLYWTKKMTAAQFKSGEVAYLLGDGFGQNLAENGDTYPVFATDTNKVYQYRMCDGEMIHSNDSALFGDATAPYHTFTEDSNGFCTRCDGFEAPTLNSDGYYEISNAGQLYWFADKVNKEQEAYASANAILIKDITVNENVLTDTGELYGDGSNFRVWTPIGQNPQNANTGSYTGIFDGNGKTVSGLYYNSNSNYIGLFGYVEGGTIQNVSVSDSYFLGSKSVGGVVGRMISGDVINCHNAGSVRSGYDYMVGGVVGYTENGLVSGCSNTGFISSVKNSVGGVVGHNMGSTVENCYNAGRVEITDTGIAVGGVVGLNEGPVKNCYNTGSVRGINGVVGGVLGSNSSSVQYCYNTADIVVEDDSSDKIGGVIGANYSSGTVEYCYNVGNISGIKYVGGVLGSNSGTIRNCYNVGNVSGGLYVGSVNGLSSNGVVELCYYLSGTAEGGDSGWDKDGCTVVKSAEQFASGEVAYLLSNGVTDGTQAFYQTVGEGLPAFSGATVYYGYTYCGDAEKVYTNSENVSETKLEHTGILGAPVPTEDGTQHVATWSCCGTTVTEDHSTTAAGDKAAICSTPAYCSVCKSGYGEEDLTHHDETVEFVNGFCPHCDIYEPATLVTEANYASLGLTSDYVGYYAIGNAGQLYWFADKVVNENATYGSANVILTANITVNENVLTDADELNGDGSNFRAWPSIGTGSTTAYNGIFDGNGKTVSGLYVNTKSQVIWDIGLIGYLGKEGTVKNVGVIDSYICADMYAGGVVGDNKGIVQNCYNTGVINANEKVGGVVGSNEGTVQNCYNMGSVSGKKEVGGIIGINIGTVENCYNTGSVSGESRIGGLVGTLGGIVSNVVSISIKNCYNTGNVSGTQTVGGIIGSIVKGNVSNCYYLSTENINKELGGINGADVAGQAEGKSAEQFASGEVAYLIGSAWGQTLGTDTFPVFGGDTVYPILYCDGTPYSYSNTESNEQIHKNNVYGYCELCQVKITGASITAGVDLTVKYYVGLYDTDLVGEGQKLAMIFTMNGKTVTVSANETLVDGEYVFEFTNIAPQQMADLIDATLVIVDESGAVVDTLAEKKGYSVKANLVALLGMTNEQLGINTDAKRDALNTLIADLLEYGAAAQIYKTYNTESLVNAGIENKPEASTWTDLDSGAYSLTANINDEYRFIQAGVYFNNINCVFFRFKAADLTEITLTVNGNAVATEDIVDLGNGTYAVYLEELSATKLGTAVYTVVLTVGEECQTLTYGVQSFVYSMQGKNDATAELAKTLWLYGQSATVYENTSDTPTN